MGQLIVSIRCKTEKERKTRRAAVQRRYEASPRGKYRQHQKNAKRRGVPFEITFDQWWAVWEASGKWSLRGLKRGTWVMGRHNDQGPYAIGNVEIIKRSSNTALRNTQHRKFSSKHYPWSSPDNPEYESWQHVHGGINDD